MALMFLKHPLLEFFFPNCSKVFKPFRETPGTNQRPNQRETNQRLTKPAFLAMGEEVLDLVWRTAKSQLHLGRFVWNLHLKMNGGSLDGTHIGVSKNNGTPKWMLYNGKPY